MKGLLVSAVVAALLGIGIYFQLSKPLPGFKDAWKLRLVSIFLSGKGLLMSMAENGLISWATYVTTSGWVTAESCRLRGNLGPYKESSVLGVPVNIFHPRVEAEEKNATVLPGIIYFHSGGYIHYPKGCSNRLCSLLANNVNAVVISVEYSLSPKAKCPIAFNECLAVTKYILQHASEFGIDKSRISVMGLSAGGGIAMSVAYRLGKDERTRGLVKLQIALNPFLQMFNTNLTSHNDAHDRPSIVQKKDCCVFASACLTGTLDFIDSICQSSHTKHLQGTKYDPFSSNWFEVSDNDSSLEYAVVSPSLQLDDLRTLLNPNFFPFMGRDFSGLSPLYLVSSEYDVFRDETLDLVSRWRRGQGVITHKHYATFHGSIVLCDGYFCPDSARISINDLIQYLKEQL